MISTKNFEQNVLGLTVAAGSEGGVAFKAGKNSVVLKRNARKTFKSIRNTTNQGNFRKDQKVRILRKKNILDFRKKKL